MAKRSKTHVPKFASKKRKRKLERAAIPDLLSPEALADGQRRTEVIRKQEAASMQRLFDSGRLTEKDLQVTINVRG